MVAFGCVPRAPVICVASQAPLRSLELIGPRPRVLVIDATNVLSRASADSKRLRHAGGHSLQTSFEDWLAFLQAAAAPDLAVAVFDDPSTQRRARQSVDPSYLERRRRKQGQGATQPGAASAAKGRDKLVPLARAVETRGGVCLTAGDGLEADDVIGAACAYLAEAIPSCSLVIASGDADMQQHMRQDRVSWLQLLPLPTAAAPAGAALLRAEDFQRQFSFPPAAYPDYLALVGKKEASVGGVGTGAATAAKLLARFGSIGGIAAAAQSGALKGWGRGVEAAFSPGSPTLEKAKRSLRVFAGAGAVDSLGEADRRALASVQGRLLAASGGAAAAGEEALAWHHPLHAARWRSAAQFVERLAAAAAREGVECAVKATSEGGLPIDGVIGSQAVMLCCECDFEPGAAAPLAAAHSAKILIDDVLRRESESRSSDGGKAIAPLLNGAVRHHLGLLRRAGVRPALVPWWQVP